MNLCKYASQAVSILVVTVLLVGCSSEELPTDVDTRTRVSAARTSGLGAEFQRRVNDNDYFNKPALAIGLVMWQFTAPNIVTTSVVNSRIGNAWLMLTYHGFYTLEGDDWPLTMTCQFSRKTIWWYGEEGLPDVEMTWDEEFEGQVEFSGQMLVIDGARYTRI